MALWRRHSCQVARNAGLNVDSGPGRDDAKLDSANIGFDWQEKTIREQPRSPSGLAAAGPADENQIPGRLTPCERAGRPISRQIH